MKSMSTPHCTSIFIVCTNGWIGCVCAIINRPNCLLFLAVCPSYPSSTSHIVSILSIEYHIHTRTQVCFTAWFLRERNMYSSLSFILSLIILTLASAHNITVTWVGGWSCNLQFLGKTYQCALGKNGVTQDKKEGDGKTPLGIFPLRRAFYRADRVMDPTIPYCYGAAPHLKCEATQTNYGWVDASTDPLYNQFVYLPYNASHEELYLSSSVYDLLAVIGYNDDPVIPNDGSAIFFHVASSGYGSTAGCISMDIKDLSYVLSHVTSETRMIITDGSK